MTAHRATILAASAAALALTGAPAVAQVDQGIVLAIMRECSRIDDPTARLACYDNNIRQAGGVARSSVPGQMARPQGGAAPGNVASAQGFGGETIRTAPQPGLTPMPGPAPAMSSRLSQITPKVNAVAQREPGVYLVTLEDGAQWQFAESVDFAYRPPVRGSTIEIERGALGNFLMRVDGQEPVSVRRIR